MKENEEDEKGWEETGDGKGWRKMEEDGMGWKGMEEDGRG